MMISGYFTYFDMPLVQFLKKKTTQLILPTLAWGAILCFIWDGVMLYIGEGSKLSIGKFIFCFWFIKALFICNIVGYIGFRYLPNIVSRLVFFLVVMSLCNKYLQITYMLPCFLLGYIYKKYLDNKYINNLTILSLFIVYAFLLCFWKGEDIFFEPITLYGIVYKHIHVGINCLSRELYHIIVNLVGAASLFMLFKKMEFTKKSIDSFVGRIVYIGRFTMIIYIVQTFFIEELLGRTKLCNILVTNFQSISFKYLIMFPLIILITIILSLRVVTLCKQSKKMSVMFLGRK